VVLGTQLDGPDRALDRVRVDFDETVFKEDTEPFPMAQRVAGCIGECVMSPRRARAPAPAMSSRPRPAADSRPGGFRRGNLAGANARLDLVGLCDPPQRQGDDRRVE
jgi:hypothetical protein